jgi:hypothetical protein
MFCHPCALLFFHSFVHKCLTLENCCGPDVLKDACVAKQVHCRVCVLWVLQKFSACAALLFTTSLIDCLLVTLSLAFLLEFIDFMQTFREIK